MKILTNKQYKDLIDKVAPNKYSLSYKQQVGNLTKELENAKDLRKILETIGGININGITLAGCGGSFKISVDDILGGKVIKQEGIKCLVIDKNGNVKTGLTKQKRDDKYTYKLVRE